MGKVSKTAKVVRTGVAFVAFIAWTHALERWQNRGKR